MALTLRPKDDEDYFQCYKRTLGSVDRYQEMTPKELGRVLTVLQGEYGAALLILRRQPNSISGTELLNLVEPHYDAAIKAARTIGNESVSG